MRNFNEKSIQNHQVDYDSDLLSNLTSNNDNGDINKQRKQKTCREYLKSWVGIFQAGIFWVGIFRGGIHQGEV